MLAMKEYARIKGISYEAVRRQVARYADELDGHIHTEGRTRYLDDEAVAFLDERRAGNPIVIYEQSKDDEIEALRARVEDLTLKYALVSNEAKELYKQQAIDAAALHEANQTRVALEAAQTKIEEVRQEARDALCEAAKAEARAEALAADLEAERAKNEALRARGLWARIRNK